METSALKQDYKVIWRPQIGAQTYFLKCPVFEVLYGGSRGSGKTDAVVGEFGAHAGRYGRDAIGLMVRRERTQLIETIERAKQIYIPLGSKWNDTEKQFTFSNGARLRMAHLDRDSDAEAYQGHSYCVAVGTRIRMADGSLRRIEVIRPGEMVATLEGPRRVSAVTVPYRAPCVEALVRDGCGEVAGVQIHPVWHPVLTTSGLIASHRHRTRQTASQQQRVSIDRDKQVSVFRRGVDQEIPAWLSWSGGGGTDCKVSSHSRPEKQRLESLCVPVVLHEPAGRLASLPSRVGRMESKLSRAFCKLSVQWLHRFRHFLGSLWGQQPRFGRVLSKLGRCFLCLPNVGAYGLNGLGIIRDFPLGYRNDYGFCGEPSRLSKETDQGRPPSQGGVENKLRRWLSGVLGTIPSRTHPLPRSWVHPYSGEVRNLSESVTIGTMELRECGEAYVADLTVEWANHYITETGLVNKNSRVYVEEIGNFPDKAPVLKLMATLRSANGVPVGFRATGNPGGPGASWVKTRYIDPDPLGYTIIKDEFSGLERVFIPARVFDNKRLLDSDPGYIDRLKASGSPELVRAWLYGDWSAVVGAYFPEFSVDKHVVGPLALPKNWVRFRAMDWGSYRPSAVLWFAVSDGTMPEFPSNALICYREVYTASELNVGMKLTAEEVADLIADAERGERIDYGVIDPSAFKEDGGPSIAERMSNRKVSFIRADNSRLPGWDQLRQRLKGEESPMLYIFSTCTNLIRTLPAMQHDLNKPEDLETESDDHAADACRYGCASRPYKRPEPKLPIKADGYRGNPDGTMTSNLTWREMMKRLERKARAS